MKLLHVVKQKFDTGPQDLDKLCKSNTSQDMGSLQKKGFLEKTRFFFTGPTVLGSLKLFVYIYI